MLSVPSGLTNLNPCDGQRNIWSLWQAQRLHSWNEPASAETKQMALSFLLCWDITALTTGSHVDQTGLRLTLQPRMTLSFYVHMYTCSHVFVYMVVHACTLVYTHTHLRLMAVVHLIYRLLVWLVGLPWGSPDCASQVLEWQVTCNFKPWVPGVKT